MTFIAIDVETANADMSSICQIGLAQYSHASIQDEWKTYIDPDDYFDPINTSIHGIDEETVRGAPRLPDIADKICTLMDDRIAVCHTHFDRTAISQAFQKHDLRHPKCVWLDSARVSRRTWTDFARGATDFTMYVNTWDMISSIMTPLRTQRRQVTSSSLPLKRLGYP